jgi:hypothetical protein
MCIINYYNLFLYFVVGHSLFSDQAVLISPKLSIDGKIVHADRQPFRDRQRIELSGTMMAGNDYKVDEIVLVLWAGGLPRTVPKANEGAVETIVEVRRDKRNVEYEWAGSLTVNYTGAMDYFIEAVPMDAKGRLFKINGKVASWYKKISLAPRKR